MAASRIEERSVSFQVCYFNGSSISLQYSNFRFKHTTLHRNGRSEMTFADFAPADIGCVYINSLAFTCNPILQSSFVFHVFINTVKWNLVITSVKTDRGDSGLPLRRNEEKMLKFRNAEQHNTFTCVQVLTELKREFIFLKPQSFGSTFCRVRN